MASYLKAAVTWLSLPVSIGTLLSSAKFVSKETNFPAPSSPELPALSLSLMVEAKKRGTLLKVPFAGFGKASADPEKLTATRQLSMPPPKYRPTAVVTTLDNVLSTVRAHQVEPQVVTTDSSDPRLVSKRPKFDELALYDVSEDEEDKIWEIEVKRLMAAVKDGPDAFAFKTYGLFQQPDCKSSYDYLASLADQLLVNLHICRLDNELMLQRSDDERLQNQTAMSTSESIINNRLQNGNWPSKSKKGSNVVSDFTRSYIILVDYITAVVARFAVSGAENDAWQRRALAGIARHSAKLKILARKPELYASRSVESSKQYRAERRVMQAFDTSKAGISSGTGGPQGMGNDMAHRNEHKTGDNMWDYDFNYNNYGGGGMGMGMGGMRMGMGPMYQHRDGHQSQYRKELDALINMQDHKEDLYFTDSAAIFRFTSASLFSVVYPLMASGESGFPIDGFDISTVTYQGGTTDSPLPIYVHQDRGGELEGSSYLGFTKHAYLAFAQVKHAVNSIRKAQADRSNDSIKASSGSRDTYSDSIEAHELESGTLITMQLQDGISEPDEPGMEQQAIKLRLTSLGEIIAVMIPLLLTSPNVVSRLQSSLRSLGDLLSINVEEKLTPNPPEFTAMVSLRTRTFQSASSSCLPEADFRPLSLSLLAHADRQISHPKVPTSTAAWDLASTSAIKQRIEEVQKRRERLAQEGHEWDIEEMAVRVKCAKYVYTVLACAGILVIGGLVCGFTVGDRLEGVDPFNIATFAWLLAGFIILVAKSIRVTEWPWRDFLLGRVTCRSLSELRAVTGANEQDLYLYLLTKESETVLVSRGPYNKMFTRREGHSSGGFSIDIKPEVRTLVAAGLILVKVSMQDGSALVCLDLRRGSEKRDVRMSIRQEGNESGDHVCRYPPRPGDRIQDVELSRAPMWAGVRWNRILGIYHAADRKVR